MSNIPKQLSARQIGRNVIMIIDGKKYTKKTETDQEITFINNRIKSYNKNQTENKLEEIRNWFKSPEKEALEKKQMEEKAIKSQLKKEKKIGDRVQKLSNKNLLSKIKKRFPAYGNLLAVRADGNMVMAGCESVAMPDLLVARIEEFLNKKQDIKPLLNFWSLALLNPNHVARTKLFDYLQRNGLTITPSGYFVTYRMVKRTEELGVFTDAYTGSMRYYPGTVCRIPREECDEDGARDCSQGLHTGTPRFIGIVAEKKYNLDEAKEGVGDGYGIKRVVTKEEVPDSYGTGYDRPTRTKERTQEFDQSFGNQAIICLINPQHVVSVPDSDTRKMRSCEFYFCKLTTPEEVIDMVEKDYLLFDHDYQKVELEEIRRMLKDKDLKEYTSPRKKSNKKIEQLEKALEEKREELKLSNDNISSDLDISSISAIIKQRLVTLK